MKDSRLQVDLNQDALALLDSLMVQVRRDEGNRKIGAGTIAARIIETIASHPEMIQQLLQEYAENNDSGEAAPHDKAQTTADPFAVTRKPKPGRLKKAA